MSWIQTYTGKQFDLLDPKLDQIDIEDIAHALSQICRFTGHTASFYSVAQHSLLVSYQVPQEYALEGLLHDAHEAYITDLSTPLKALVPGYRDIEAGVWAAVSAKFDLPYKLHDSVKEHDLRALVTERRELLDNPNNLRWDARLEAVIPYPFIISPVSPHIAERDFLDRYNELVLLRRRANG